MQDPTITLRKLLVDNWSLSSPLSTSEVKFSTGWYDKALENPQVTITPLYVNMRPAELGYGWIRFEAVYSIDIWVVQQKATGKGPGTARSWLHSIFQEVVRILKASLKGNTDIDWVIMEEQARRLDEPTRTPPILRWSIQVKVIYHI